ncbi:hypothetical protein BDZ89DRAFT_516061 [Hymenopellis radicata]|nr:hypothetical protein BDZ89DRAFT_516061 [Hymenopellis radicata]
MKTSPMYNRALIMLPLFLSVCFGSVLPGAFSSNSARDLLEARIPTLFFEATTSWIWTGEQNSLGVTSYNVNQLSSASPTCLTVALAADNGYVLYVNGVRIGDNLSKLGLTSSFTEAEVYSVPLNSVGANVIAVNATNVDVGSRAALIATGVVQYSDGSQVQFGTRNTWKTLKAAIPSGFQATSFNDASWTAAVAEGGQGTSPWGFTTILPFTGTECGVLSI